MAACVLQHFRFERFGLIYKEKVKFIVLWQHNRL